MSYAVPRRGRTLARAIIGGAVYLTGVGLLLYAIPADSETYLPGGLLAGIGAGLQGPALLTLVRERKRRLRENSHKSYVVGRGVAPGSGTRR